MNHKRLNRRDFLRISALSGMAVFAAGCGVTTAPPAAPTNAPIPPTQAVEPTIAAPTAEPVEPTQVIEPTKAPPATEPVKLQFWSWGFAEWIGPRMEAYKKIHPEVEIVHSTGVNDEKLLTAIAAGTPPNSMIYDRFRVCTWAIRGSLTKFDDYLTTYNVSADDYWPSAWAEVNWEDHVYAMPLEADGRLLYTNKDVFAANGLDPDFVPPTHDWNAMIELGKKLTKKTSSGDTDVLGWIPTWFPNLPTNGGDYVIPWANGGEFMKDKKTAWMDNPKLVEALQFELDAVNSVGGIKEVAKFASALPNTSGYSSFGAGKLAFFIGGDWELANFAKYYPDLKFNCTPWRMRDDPSKNIGFMGGLCMAVPTGAKEIPASFDWINFLMNYESQVQIGIILQVIPTLKKAALSDELIQKSPYPEIRKLANASMQYAKYRPVSPVGTLMQDLWNTSGRDAVFYGDKTAEQSCKDMQAEVQKALDDFWKTAG
jgi:multiple sugar transport system substrate-binding protein